MLALALVLLQTAPVEVPSALRDRGTQVPRFETAAAAGSIDWDARARTVTLSGRLRPDFEVSFDLVEAVDFQPTAARGLGPGRLAVAGRDGPRVRIELWQVEDVLTPEGPATWGVTARTRLWEALDDDSIGVLIWNPVPPPDASLSLRGLWHARRELVRYDVDGLDRTTPALEASAREPDQPGVLHVPGLSGPLQRHFQARHAERGLVLMLRNPPAFAWECESPTDERMVRIALMDRDLDGRLDASQRIDIERWNAEEWGWIPSYAQVYR